MDAKAEKSLRKRRVEMDNLMNDVLEGTPDTKQRVSPRTTTNFGSHFSICEAIADKILPKVEFGSPEHESRIDGLKIVTYFPVAAGAFGTWTALLGEGLKMESRVSQGLGGFSGLLLLGSAAGYSIAKRIINNRTK